MGHMNCIPVIVSKRALCVSIFHFSSSILSVSLYMKKENVKKARGRMKKKQKTIPAKSILM